MATIADTHTKLAADLADTLHAIWTGDEITRCVTHVLEDLAAHGIGNQTYTDHLGDGTAKIKITDHATIQTVLGVEWPIGDEPPTTPGFHLDSDGTDTWIVLHSDDLPAASEYVRIYHLSTLADVPLRLEATVLAGGRMYAFEMACTKVANALGVDAWVANRYRDLHDRAQATYEHLLSQLPRWIPPHGHAPNRARWGDLA